MKAKHIVIALSLSLSIQGYCQVMQDLIVGKAFVGSVSVPQKATRTYHLGIDRFHDFYLCDRLDLEYEGNSVFILVKLYSDDGIYVYALTAKDLVKDMKTSAGHILFEDNVMTTYVFYDAERDVLMATETRYYGYLSLEEGKPWLLGYSLENLQDMIMFLDERFVPVLCALPDPNSCRNCFHISKYVREGDHFIKYSYKGSDTKPFSVWTMRYEDLREWIKEKVSQMTETDPQPVTILDADMFYLYSR